MKEDMMVVGITAVDEDMIEIKLVPLIITKKRVNLLDVARSGNGGAIIKAIKGEQQHRTTIYRSKEWVSKKQITIFSTMTLNLENNDNHKQET